MIVLAIDPGGVETGVILRDGATLVAHDLVARKVGEPQAAYVTAVIETVEARRHRLYPDVIAVEGVKRPNPHVRLSNPQGIIDTAVIFGAILGQWPTAVVVPPGEHGRGPLQAYPPALRPARGHGKGADALRHCRAAWDIASAAITMVRVDAAATR